jgi:hypothetical protein
VEADFERMDKDGAGKVSWDEFDAWSLRGSGLGRAAASYRFVL